MFTVRSGDYYHGYSMTFANGYTISVQWGASNYCANKYKDNPPAECINAEVAAWHESEAHTNKYYKLPGANECAGTVQPLGWCDANKVAELIAHVAALPPKGE